MSYETQYTKNAPQCTKYHDKISLTCNEEIIHCSKLLTTTSMQWMYTVHVINIIVIDYDVSLLH